MQWPYISYPRPYAKQSATQNSKPMWKKLLAIICSGSLCLACTHSPLRDGAPARHFDPGHLPEPSPKIEPMSHLGNPLQYEVGGIRYTVLQQLDQFKQSGIASWYGTKFHKKSTSSGEAYDMYELTAAHKTLPLPSYVRVTRKDNGQSLIVRVNDRGPFHEGRIIDLSYAAAIRLGIDKSGTAPVEIELLAAPKADKRNRYYIQAGAFSNLLNAQLLSAKLKKANLQHSLKTYKKNRNATIYKVRAGPFQHAREVEQASTTLDQLGIANSYVVVEND